MDPRTNRYQGIPSLIGLVAVLAAGCASPERPELATTPHTPDSASLLLRCGELIDGVADQPRSATDVLIERGRIAQIDVGIESPPGVAVLDLSAYTCLPGLIDMHTHLMDMPEDTADFTVYYEHTLEHTLEDRRTNAEITLLTGITTVRNLGTYHGWSSRVLRDQINRGEAPGPRMQIAGYYLSIPFGGGDLHTPGVEESDIPSHNRMGVTRGEAGFQAKAQAAVDGGADVLKLIASGAVLAYGGIPGAPEIARRAGDWIADEGRKQGWPEEFLRKNDETTLTQCQGFRKAHAAGVTLPFGTDASIYTHGLNNKQFAYMVEWGMIPMEAIKAATSIAARVLGWEDRVGALKAGLYGDLIAVKGDPLDDVSRLEQVEVVVKGGHIFKAPPDQFD